MSNYLFFRRYICVIEDSVIYVYTYFFCKVHCNLPTFNQLSDSFCRPGYNYNIRRNAVTEFIYSTGRPVKLADDPSFRKLLMVYDKKMPPVTARQVKLTVGTITV